MSQGHQRGIAGSERLGNYLVALGGNLDSGLGRPAATLDEALLRISRALGPVVARSRLWRTPAHPPGSGPDYVNAAACVASALPPQDFLSGLHRIEADLGRIRTTRWAARPVDLDLLAAGDLVLPDAATQDLWRNLPAVDQTTRTPDRLILPHPRLQDRAFVLVPLAEVAPHWRHPRLGLDVTALLARLSAVDLAGIAPLGPNAV